MNRNWVYIFIGAFFEVLWVTGLKHSSTAWMWIGTIIAMYISFHLVISASTKLPVGTVYAVFTGMGTAGTVLVEMLLFGEPFRILKVCLILLLLSGVFGLKFVTKEHNTKGAAV
ncbi:DMT family transporter [Paenibacillus planticolens]|uniref:QacE family quaternary ammonium compound efflux SMR transporter n=1 Tax=Paenibacillus planticolens TaxID=2654976 RepID=A0ABX1ZJM1_9BACL|nr:multidrug efflux SMR transporter [Paenibacillus planticolens]NOU98844.1 QacE family quaternary ammonium compound efflux SMR transporter [Paenibacillus planticolens]